jgi:hypothetical protein
MADFRLVGAAPSRLIAKRPRVFFDGAVGDAGLNADSVPTLAPVKRGAQLFALPGAECRASQALALGARPLDPSLGALSDLIPLELGELRENREKDVADQLVIRRQMRLAVAVGADAIGVETLQVDHGRSHAIAGEPVERPYKHHVELAPRSIAGSTLLNWKSPNGPGPIRADGG